MSLGPLQCVLGRSVACSLFKELSFISRFVFPLLVAVFFPAHLGSDAALLDYKETHKGQA